MSVSSLLETSITMSFAKSRILSGKIWLWRTLSACLWNPKYHSTDATCIVMQHAQSCLLFVLQICTNSTNIGSFLSYSSNKTVPTNNRIFMRHEGIWFFITMPHRCAQIVNVSRFESHVQGFVIHEVITGWSAFTVETSAKYLNK